MAVLPISDFVIKSIPDQVEFGVQRCALQTAEVFRDMFALCDRQPASADGEQPTHRRCYLELDERAEDLRMLLELLHRPPSPPPPPPHDEASARARWLRAPFSPRYDPACAIPLPLLPRMLRLADKYGLPGAWVRALHAHLLANAFVQPLQVYGFAAAAAEGYGKGEGRTQGLADVAAQASAYLLDPPLATYTRAEVAGALTVAAYHDLVRLHAHRIARLRAVLAGEDIFPFGYGACAVHRTETVRAWNECRARLAQRIEAASDLAAEMRVLLGQFSSCQTCSKACVAASDMLEYKCRRIPRTIAQLPPPK